MKKQSESVSQTQQRLMGMAWAYQKGELSLKGLPADVKEKIKSLVGEMKKKDLSDFAHTTHENLPERITSIMDELIISNVMKKGKTSTVERGDEIKKLKFKEFPNEVKQALKAFKMSADDIIEGYEVYWQAFIVKVKSSGNFVIDLNDAKTHNLAHIEKNGNDVTIAIKFFGKMQTVK